MIGVLLVNMTSVFLPKSFGSKVIYLALCCIAVSQVSVSPQVTVHILTDGFDSQIFSF